MLGLIGIKKKVDINIREKFAISSCNKEKKLKELLKVFQEVVLLNTCNRVEVYFHFHEDKDEDKVLNKIFQILEWEEELREHIFFIKEKEVIKHLFEVSCGCHSKIRGEDQILGQIKTAYMDSLEIKGANNSLGRLFQEAIACGKRFRSEARLYEIPVSSISIVINKLLENNCKGIMVIGYGEMGRLAIKYILDNNFKEIYLVVRNTHKCEEILDKRVKVITFEEKDKYINKVDGIISCTSSPYPVVLENQINKEGSILYCFDMAIPRDIEEKVANINRVRMYNIDEISKIDDKNKLLRIERMEDNKRIINEGIEEYLNWIKIRGISPHIKRIKNNSTLVYKKRLETYENKKEGNSEKNSMLVEQLLKSTSDFYANRAIKVLKEEKLKGNEEECIRILSKIFHCF